MSRQNEPAPESRENRVSYSELKVWNDCTYKHKLRYIDEVSGFTGNEFTAFGTAVHTVCENLLLGTVLDPGEEFQKEFQNELAQLAEVNPELTDPMKTQGPKILGQVLEAVEQNFSKYEVFSTEEELYEPIGIENVSKQTFKGFIDLVLKIGEVYHVIDWKTCTWGWNYRKKSDPMNVYQLMLYKKYFSEKHNIPLTNIKTHFALLKRTASSDNIEIFEVTSGEKRVANAFNLLKRALVNIEKKVFIKNRLSCKYCEFYKTEHCK